jgi:L-arabinose isomerase
MERKRRLPARVGVFGIGLAAYWPQFEGLRERLESYQRDVEGRLRDFGCEVVTAGLVDTAPAAQAAGDLFTRENVDLLICYVGTYATSSQVLPAVQRRRAPVLVLNLQPEPALDYENVDTGEWLANCCACCVPEIANAFAV